MKTITFLGMMLISANLFAGEMHKHIQGTWQVDLEATKKLPEIEKALEENKFLGMMLQANAQTTYEFKETSVIITPTIEGKKEPMPEVTCKVIENTEDEVTLEGDKAGVEKIHLKKFGDAIILQAEQEGEKGPSLVLTKVTK